MKKLMMKLSTACDYLDLKEDEFRKLLLPSLAYLEINEGEEWFLTEHIDSLVIDGLKEFIESDRNPFQKPSDNVSHLTPVD